MSDRIAVMSGGRVEQLGTPEELYERPRDEVRGRLHRDVEPPVRNGRVDRGLDAPSSGSGLATAAGSAGRAAPRARRSTLSLRPESIRIERATGRRARPSTGCPATVEQVAYLGSSVQYRVRTPGGLTVAVLAGKQGPRFARGDDVELAWAPSEALVLDERADRKEEQP